MPDFVRHLVIKASGPMASVYACPFCKHMEKIPRGLPGVGRGHGLRTGGGAHSRMSAHIRQEHAAEAAQVIAEVDWTLHGRRREEAIKIACRRVQGLA